MITEKLIKLSQSDNIAEDLDEQQLQEIGMQCSRDYDTDEASRKEWLDMMQEAIKIAKQVLEQKTTPWPGAANVKYPLITSSIISFASRTYPEVVRGDKVVMAGIIGPPDPEKEKIAAAISDHLSYQLLIESPNWEEDTDKLLMVLPLMGLVYRKSYYDPINQMPATDLCLPDKITVNNHIKTIETARRITHQLDLYENDVIERIRLGIYRDVDLEKIRSTVNDNNDEDLPLNFCEQHRYLDLDDDGYQEPYIVTFHKDTQIVFRIVARFDLDKIIVNEKNGKIIRIPPVNYFTDYHFIPNPDGSFHSIGYGSLLYPINETINTTVNQILDAGTLSNRQSGFLGKGLRMGKGVVQFKPGEWKTVEAATGTDISKNIVPLPVREPSPVLFNMLNMMISSGKELASVTDILQGQQPAQNSPATTVLALIEQGLKVHTAIVKRLHRALKKEFEKLVRLNRLYMDDEIYYRSYSGEGTARQEYYANENLLVFPISDPNMSSDAQRMARAQALMSIKDDPQVDKREILLRWLDALQIPNIEKILPEPDPDAPPPPDVQKMFAEIDFLKAQIGDILMKRELEAFSLHIRDKESEARAAEGAARVSQMKHKTVAEYAKLEQEGQHFAIEKGIKDLQEEDQEPLPIPQEINYEPEDFTKIQEDLAAMNPNQAAQPEQAPEVQQEIPPEVLEQIQQEEMMNGNNNINDNGIRDNEVRA